MPRRASWQRRASSPSPGADSVVVVSSISPQPFLVSPMVLSRSVRIRLDGGNDQVLHPGQALSGTVEYKAPPGEYVTGLTIDFRGVTKILPKKGSKLNTEYIEIFHMGEKLLRPPGYFCTKPGGKYVWHFSFNIPKLTGPDRSDGVYQDPGHALFQEGLHILPPSVEDGLSPEVRIEYNMYAVAEERTLPPTQGRQQQENMQSRPVVHNLERLRLVPDVEQVDYGEPQTYEKTFEVAAAPRRRFSIGSAKSTGLAHPFTLVAQVPRTVVAGDSLCVSLSIVHAQTAPSNDIAYSTKLTTLTVQSRTHRRTAKVAHDSGLTSMALTKLDTRKAARPIPVAPAAPLVLTFPTDALTKLPPTFRSYSISREYHMVLDITFEGEGKREFNTQWIIPFELVYRASAHQILTRRASTAPPPPPPLVEPEAVRTLSNGSGTFHARRGVQDDLPPDYEPRRS